MLTIEDKLFLSNLVSYFVMYFAAMIISLYLLFFVWKMIRGALVSLTDYLVKKFPIEKKIKIIEK